MKRRTVTQREEAQALEKARQHQGELLDTLRAREAARRESSTTAGPAPTSPPAAETPAPPATPPEPAGDEETAPET